MEKFQVLLFYKFAHISNPEALAGTHREFCRTHNLRGRILIAAEGINGTVSGSLKNAQAYINWLKSDPHFEDIEFKIDPSTGHVFEKMFIRVRREIVTLGLQDVNPEHETAPSLEPKDFASAMRDPDTVLLDIRNDYEYEVGHFHNAIRPNVGAFKEFPSWIEEHKELLESKKILTYCTGGIRCEKLTSYLLKSGFKKVFQLKGGIVNYSKDPHTLGSDFDGRCYVFDQRISVPVNHVNPTIISRCHHCQRPCEEYVNCANLDCHVRFFCCEECARVHLRSCSAACREVEHHEFRIKSDRV